MNSENRNSIRVREGNPEISHRLKPSEKFERIRKPLIYFLMAVVCAGCLYLIFKPKKEDAVLENAGFNAAVPQAADDKLQSDKQKAYEQQLLEQQNEEKRNALTSLSDYWTEGDSTNFFNDRSSSPGSSLKMREADRNALSSYRNAQQTLGSFYSRDHTEVENLKREISRLKSEAIHNRPEPRNTALEDQLELMEKSYQMAVKYLPAAKQQEETKVRESVETKTEGTGTELTAARPLKRNMVLGLYRDSSDSALVAGLSHERFNGLQSDDKSSVFQNRNSIRAIICETKTMVAESTIALRLTEPMMLGTIRIPAGTIVKAMGKLEGGRLQLKISSIEYRGSIIPVEINIHDNDGQLGLYIPYSPEQHALKDIAANMSQNSGTSIMMTQSAGQQVAADLTRGLVQGVSGYFQKKVRLPKVTVKAGHQVFLVSKK